ncbi:MAG: PQQ-binding-like beta-propeller repeat protein [Planctomycetota bacterium]
MPTRENKDEQGVRYGGWWIILVLILSCASPAFSYDWPTFRGNEARTGVTSETVGYGFTAGWAAVEFGGVVIASPVADNDRVYLGTRVKGLVAVDRKTGASVWEAGARGAVDGTPALRDGVIYYGTRAGWVAAVRAATGAELWAAQHGGKQGASVLVTSERVIVGVGAPLSRIEARRRTDGTLVWTREMPQLVYSTAAVDEAAGALYVGAGDGSLYRLNLEDGGSQWQMVTDGGVYLATPALSGGVVYMMMGDQERNAYAVQTNGTVKWATEMGTPAPAASRAASRGGVPPMSTPDPMGPGLDEISQEILDAPPGDREMILKRLEGELGRNLDVYRPFVEAGKTPAAGAPSRAAPQMAGGFTALNQWQVSSGAVSGNRVVFVVKELGVPNSRWNVVAQSTVNGATLWRYQVLAESRPWGFTSSPAVSGGVVYAGVGTKLMALDLATGTVLGETDLAVEILGSPAPSNGSVYVTTADGKLHALQGPNAAPSAPGALSPSGGEIVKVTTKKDAVLTWTASDSNNAAGTLVHRVEWNVGAAEIDLGATGAADIPAGTTRYTLPKDFPRDAAVFWRVKTRDPSGAESAWSAVAAFQVKAAGSVKTPAKFRGTGAFRRVTLDWEAEEVPEGFRLYVKEKGKGSWGIPLVLGGDATSCAVEGLSNGTRYQFLIVAYFADLESAGAMTEAETFATARIGGMEYPTVQAALNAAKGGETVEVLLAEIAETLIIPARVRLSGAGPGRTVLRGTPVSSAGPHKGAVLLTSGAVVTLSDGSSLEGVSVAGGETGVEISSDAQDVVVRNVIVTGNGAGVRVKTGAGAEVVNVTAADNLGDGVVVVGGGATAVSLRNLLVATNGGRGIAADAGMVVAVTYSSLWGNPEGNLSNVQTGAGTLAGEAGEVAFVDRGERGFHEPQGSVAVDGGFPEDDYANEPLPSGNRVNQGAYGNTSEAATTLPPGAIPQTDDPIGGGDGGGGGGGCFLRTAGMAAGSLGQRAALALYLPSFWMIGTGLFLRRRLRKHWVIGLLEDIRRSRGNGTDIIRRRKRKTLLRWLWAGGFLVWAVFTAGLLFLLGVIPPRGNTAMTVKDMAWIAGASVFLLLGLVLFVVEVRDILRTRELIEQLGRRKEAAE